MMGRINEHNYEAFYLDYLEGNLSGEVTAELFHFLDKNPELKAELDEVDLIELPTPSTDSPLDKSALKQNIDASNVDNYIIASLENDISEEDAEELAEYLANSPEATKLATRYQKTIFQKLDMAYPEKDKLKKPAPVVAFMPPLARAAAVALIVLLVSPPSNKQELVSVNDLPPAEFPVVDTPRVIKPVRQENYLVQVEAPKPDTRATTGQPDDAQPKPAVPIQQVQQVKAAPIDDNFIAAKKPQPVKVQQVPVMDITTMPANDMDLAEAQVPAPDTIPVTNNKEKGALENSRLVADNPGNSMDDALTLGQWANRFIRRKILGKATPKTDRIEGREVLAAVVNKPDGKGRGNIAYNYKEEDNSSSFTITIGNFEFSRTNVR